ncbi:lipopolysaccharide assembly LapA domain-containing protein [Arthrobacter sp. B3I4]|uniref:LapA family protein n=1 Tax=Arthrobacter sp. B3I4 TaxID=3042267 RepID=UPI00277D2287|nr:lipopolysaccharide assembly protein LapA domain-containing protein [Arthrobacter sp. B3I4]MDQ0756144.1 putative integral membrane protein [Arthrobacter sp. B3I4]
MTQTPRGFDPQEPVEGSNTRYPTTGNASAETPDTGYPAGGPAAGTSGVTGARSDAVATSPAEAPRTATAGTRAPAAEHHKVTRAGMVWVAVASALVVLVLLIVFILQNQVYVQVAFFGLQGSVPLGIALFIAAVGGGILVAIAGAARIIQLRRAAHRQRVGQSARTR